MKLSSENAAGCVGAASLALAMCGGLGVGALKGAEAIYQADLDPAVSTPVEAPKSPETRAQEAFSARLWPALRAAFDLQELSDREADQRLEDRLAVSQPGFTPLSQQECVRRATVLNDNKAAHDQLIGNDTDLAPVMPLDDIAGCLNADQYNGTAFIHTDRTTPNLAGWRVTNFGSDLSPSPKSSIEAFSTKDAACRYWLPNYSSGDVLFPDANWRGTSEMNPCTQAVFSYMDAIGATARSGIIGRNLVAGLDECLRDGFRTGKITDPNVLCTQLGVDPEFNR